MARAFVAHRAHDLGFDHPGAPFPTDKTKISARHWDLSGSPVWRNAGVVPTARPDVVLVMSPPLTLGLPGWVVARLRRAAFVFNVQDIFPDVAVEVGRSRTVG